MYWERPNNAYSIEQIAKDRNISIQDAKDMARANTVALEGRGLKVREKPKAWSFIKEGRRLAEQSASDSLPMSPQALGLLGTGILLGTLLISRVLCRKRPRRHRYFGTKGSFE